MAQSNGFSLSTTYTSGTVSEGAQRSNEGISEEANSDQHHNEGVKLNKSPSSNFKLLHMPQIGYETSLCLPTLKRRKKISIRIPWNSTPSDSTPSNDDAKLKVSISNSVPHSSNRKAQTT